MIRSGNDIEINKTVIVTNCLVGYYKREKQIRANDTSEVYLVNNDKLSDEISDNQSQTSSKISR